MGKINLDTKLLDIKFGERDSRIRAALFDLGLSFKTLRDLVRCKDSLIRKQKTIFYDEMKDIYNTLDKYGLKLDMSLPEMAEYEGKPLSYEMMKVEESEFKGKTEGASFSDTRGNVLYPSGDNLAVKVHDLAKEILLAELKINNIGDDEFLAESSVRLARLFYKELKKQMTI